MPFKVWFNPRKRKPRYLILDCMCCAYHWTKSQLKLPKVCPRCRNRRWNDPTFRWIDYVCSLCGHKWRSSHPNRPRKCPKCSRYMWDVDQALAVTQGPLSEMGVPDEDQSLPDGTPPYDPNPVKLD